ncbi:uncharacterized protein LOC134797362 [Cydia splendana]|uniref:uncharacterized protein LOC134797362 n=1 Tax=Cydia splendana TaxID=1100963 RepID=UPI0028F4A02D
MLVFIFVSVVLLVPYATTETCFQQRCLGCHPDDAAFPGSSIQCHPSTSVTAEWIHNLGHPPPSTDSKVPIEYHCLKMVATPDDKSFGNTVDVIRGCIPRVQVDSVCLALKAVERARGHSDARCFTCNRNNCNSATSIQIISLHIVFAIYLINFLLG